MSTIYYVDIVKESSLAVEVIQKETPSVEIVNKTIELVQNKQVGMILFDVPCDPTVYVGAALCMTANGTAKNAIATSYADSNVIGIAENKTASDKVDIRFFGATGEIYNNLDVAQEYYLSDLIAGAIVPTSQAPLTSGHIRIKLGQPFSAKEFVFSKGERIIKG